MGAAVKITRVDHTPNQPRAIAARSEDGGQARRLLALALVQEGTSRGDAARQTGMDRQTLRDLVHRFNESGVDGLIARKPPEARSQDRRPHNCRNCARSC